MKTISMIYWSGTGNTQMMADAIAAGILNKGADVSLREVSEVTDDILSGILVLGCPSMGCEVLEESEMEPFMQQLESRGLSGKSIALFGSYDWGDGQWMRDWECRIEKQGGTLLEPGLMIQNTPDAQGIEMCRLFGERLAEVS